MSAKTAFSVAPRAIRVGTSRLSKKPADPLMYIEEYSVTGVTIFPTSD